MGTFLRHEACEKCGSRDGKARYADDSSYCFVCNAVEKGTGAEASSPASRRERNKEFLEGRIQAIKSRALTEETCKRFGYLISALSDGTTCHVAPYFDKDGNLVAQKIRPPDKNAMFTIGDIKSAQLFGQKLCRGTKQLVITEGEIDTMAVSQALGHDWPVVSVPTGASGAAKALAKHIEWLESFERVVLCFDMDTAGQKAAQEVAAILSPGKVRMAVLPLKDASDCLTGGKVKELTNAIFMATPWRPEGIVSLADIAAEAKAPIEIGLPWFSKRMTELTYGRRVGEVVTVGAGTGIGKTDFVMEQVIYDVATLGEGVGLFFFEQQNAETVRRLAGKHWSKSFHIPDGSWRQEELSQAVDELAALGKVYLYRHFGQTDWDVVKSRIRYLAVSEGVRVFYIDNLTALADPSNERESLETLMAEVAGLSQELGLWVMLVSHLATPDGTPHEEGGRVMLRHFKGARAIGFWTFFALGMERDKNAEDPQSRLITTVRFLKDRYTGRADGECVHFRYDPPTCRLEEYHGPMPEDGQKVREPERFNRLSDEHAATLF